MTLATKECSTKADVLATDILNCTQRYTERLADGESVADEISGISQLCRKLEALVNPPEAWLSQVAGAYHNSIAICLALDLKIPTILFDAVEEHVSIERLALLSGASTSLLRCIMRQCILCYIFDEPSPEIYKLNNHSKSLLDTNFASWIHYLVDDGIHSGSHLPEYVAMNCSQIPNERHKTAFEIAFQTNQPFYQYYRSVDKKRGARFDSAMERYFQGSTQRPIETIFDFNSLKHDALVVDIGGGRGHHSIRIAGQNPQMSFIVQDYEKKHSTISEMDANVLKRLDWQARDFLSEQPVKGASLYFLSHILMDQPERQSHDILDRIMDVMAPKESILLIDDFLDPGKEGILSSKANSLNMHLIASFGRPFRSMDEWMELFSQASSKLSIIQTFILDDGRVVFSLEKVP